MFFYVPKPGIFGNFIVGVQTLFDQKRTAKAPKKGWTMRAQEALLLVAVFVFAGCATMPWSQRVDRVDGISEREAVIISRDFLQSTKFSSDVDQRSGKVAKEPQANCLTEHWLVCFADQNPFWKKRYYYVIVDKNSGNVLTAGVNWYQGDHWSPMLRGIDQCR